MSTYLRLRQRRYWPGPLLALPAIGLLLVVTASANDRLGPAGQEKVPLTRDAMKRALDDSKQSVPRLPLPPLTEEERTLIEEQKSQAEKAGEAPRRLGLANNGRMRAYYLPEYGFKRATDIERARAGTNYPQNSSLDPAFRVKLFWIVSRGNNCTYCLGHQESGLANRGVAEDELAALDGDWSEFDEAQRAAFAFASKLSFRPYEIADKDLAALGRHYDPAKIADIVQAVAGFNATNRWTGPLRIKQDVTFQFERPTSPKFAAAISRVAPAATTAGEDGFAMPVARPRPPLESREQVFAALDGVKTRAPRLPLADDKAAKELLGDAASAALPQWMRLLAASPKSGAERIASYQAVMEKGTLAPRVKAIIAYVGARHDRAWYALGHAMRRLHAEGFNEEQIFALDQPEELEAPRDREVARFARKITVDPALIDDDDFARMKSLFSDKEVAEVVYVTTQAAYFDRLTEAAGLPLID